MKKIIVSMSEIQTEKWMNQPEELVIVKLGAFKHRENNEMGYMLLFDYSTYFIPKKSFYTPNYPTSASSTGTNQIDKNGMLRIQPTTYVTASARPASADNLKEYKNQKTLEFYFDKNKKVIYVNAVGYPDSVRYESRHK
ncbi:MAG: hypothetical protein NTZ82_00255 [Bacteroidetes bacterium]|nr:hypothetical protein [Bacteroidota bacterium]